MQILIGIHGTIYDVSKYVDKHPGEGIANVYLHNFKRREVTDLFEKYHATNEPFGILENVVKQKLDESTGIQYVCPFFFKRRIPKYFHFLPDDRYGLEYMKDQPPCTFLLRPSNSDNNTSLSLTYKDSLDSIRQLKITKIESKGMVRLLGRRRRRIQ